VKELGVIKRPQMGEILRTVFNLMMMIEELGLTEEEKG